MKVIIFLSACFLVATTLKAQTFEWVKSFGGSSFDQGCSITTDASGNVYTTGYFSETVDFEQGEGTSNLTSSGNNDIFVQKLDAFGNFIWVKSFGGISFDQGFSITTDISGNVYTTGHFGGTTDFDPGLDTANLTSLGNYDIFVQKLDASGNFIWAKSFGGEGSFDEGFSITTDISGNVYTTGHFRGTADFDPGSDTVNLNSIGNNDIFIQKLDAYGNFIWAKSFGGSFGDESFTIITDDSGNVFTTGYFTDTVDFDPGVGTANVTTSSINHTDIFVQKLDASGNFIWVKSFGGSLSDWGATITLDDLGNVYTTGTFRNTVDFDPGVGTANLTSAGNTDIFVQKLDGSGNFIWAKTFGGSLSDWGVSVTMDDSGNVYTTGHFKSVVDFDPGAGTANLSSVGGSDIFVQKLDSDGNFIWAKSFGGSSDDLGNSITVDASGNVYTTGHFKSVVDFDPGAGTANRVSAGDRDIFVQKMSPCSPTTSTDIQSACESYTWINGKTYTASNNNATWTLINAAGCDSVVTLNLTINSVSNIYTSLDGLTLTATNSNATYQWLYCDTNYGMINDENNQTYTATTNGNFAVELTENGCVDTSACVEITTVGILENTFSQEIKVFPNPTSGKVRVAFEEALNNAEITLTDSQGNIVFTKQLDVTKEALLEIEGDAGIYFLTIKTPNEHSLVKVVKE